MIHSIKKYELSIFTGKNMSFSTMNIWIYWIRSYVKGVANDEKKIEVAASFLVKTAELWFISEIAHIKPLPSFKGFLKAIKDQLT